MSLIEKSKGQHGIAVLITSLTLSMFGMDAVEAQAPDQTCRAIWNAAEDFPEPKDLKGTDALPVNPNGAWSYGDELSGAFEPFRFIRHKFGVKAIANGIGPQSRSFAAQTGSTTEVTQTERIPPGVFWVWPHHVNYPPMILRWTAPTDGVFDITAQFAGLSLDTSVTVAVLLNGVSVWSDEVQGFHGPVNHVDTSWTPAASWSTRQDLAQGDTVDFTVDNKSDFWHNTTLIDAVIERPYLGTQEDLMLYSSVGSGSRLGAFPNTKSAGLGDLVRVHLAAARWLARPCIPPLESRGKFVGEYFLLAAEIIPTAQLNPIEVIDKLYLNPANLIVLIPPGRLPATGTGYTFPIPPDPSWLGLSLLIQGGVLSPQAANGLYATTQAHEIRIE